MRLRNLFIIFFCSLFFVQFFISCTEQKVLFFDRTKVKNFPVDTPFVFDNILNINGEIGNDMKKKLETGLEAYWDDSLKAPKVRQFGIFYKEKNPPIFDSANIARTKGLMNGFLNTQGFYQAQLLDSFYVDTFKNQLRTTIVMDVIPGKSTIIDSFSYSFKDASLEQIAKNNAKKSVIVPGKTAFSKQIIAAELDRLVNQYRRRGYFLLTRDNLVAIVDTMDISLLKLTLDPFEQAQIIAEAEARRKKNLTSIVTIQERTNPDTLHPLSDSNFFKKYYIGRNNIFPETRSFDIPDSIMQHLEDWNIDSTRKFAIYSKQDLFTNKLLRTHTFTRHGTLYNEDNFIKTLNNFSQIGAWDRVDYRTVIRDVDTVDFYYFLTPAKKETITFGLEASRNTGDFLTSSNLFGLSFNINYRNRNVWHRAIQSSTTFSNGVEVSFDAANPLLQTLQSSISHSYTFPRFIAPFKINKTGRLDAIRTIVSASATYSDRKDFFRVRSLIAGWGYEWTIKNKVWQYKPLNVELYSLDTLPLLDSAFRTNPFLRTSFNTGSVISQQLSFSVNYPDRRNPRALNYLRISAEESGTLLGLIKSLQDKIYRYVKVNIDYHRVVSYNKAALAFRATGGIGYNFGSSARFGNTLPFFKQFVEGGPNSMRAWGLRLLGLGSSIVSDTSNTFRDRYGDMQLEANLEYRYNIAQISSMKLGGALFMDVGNIWNIRKNPAIPDGEFDISRLGKDIAIGVGTGLRFDFNYFLIRVDFGIKLKDPARSENNGWLKISDFTWKNYEYGVFNPVTNQIEPLPRNNYAVQLGIGLPF